MDLFQSAGGEHQPLAARMRPRILDEFFGQGHIVGHGRLLRRVIQADQLSSLIFYGPPGTGKTSLARIIANTTKSNFITINAVLSGVKELREAIAEAREKRDMYGRRTILFVDEVHRWNKAQQDALLPWVENGTVILVGATTENPYFEVNSALVSRSRIFQLKGLDEDDLYAVGRAALTDPERGYGLYDVTIDDDALRHLVETSAGDARSLLNAVELAVETTPTAFPPPEGERIHITLEIAEESIQRKVVLYDKQGDYHYDIVSAFIKSLRGSDPDAALYWLARMVRAGEDPHFIFRRMLILASEDVGLADPAALGIVEAAAAAFDRIGLPEGRFHLTHAALYLATAPKSNSSLGFFEALAAVEKEAAGEVPNHLRDGNRDKEGFGHGEGYLYPHAFRDHWVAQQYLPTGLHGLVFYEPSDQGYELSIRDAIERRREAQIAAVIEDPYPEVLTYSPPDGNRETWFRRTSAGENAILEDVRRTVFEGLRIPRHSRILVVNDPSGLLMKEALRMAPEGGVWVTSGAERAEALRRMADSLDPADKPVVISAGPAGVSFEPILAELGAARMELVAGRNTITRSDDREGAFRCFADCLAPGGRLSLADIVPAGSQRLSGLLDMDRFDSAVRSAFHEAEEMVYRCRHNVLVDWSESDFPGWCAGAGLELVDSSAREYEEQRTLGREDIERWMDRNGGEGTYGYELSERMDGQEFERVKTAVIATLSRQSVPWKRRIAYIRARKPQQ